MTEHRDPGDENDNHLKDVRFKSGEMVRNVIHCSIEDMGVGSTVNAVNKLLKWCDWKDIQPMEFGYDTETLNDMFYVWVKGVQR